MMPTANANMLIFFIATLLSVPACPFCYVQCV
jgi:hypothetical protein